jgi:hypothetical protein
MAPQEIDKNLQKWIICVHSNRQRRVTAIAASENGGALRVSITLLDSPCYSIRQVLFSIAGFRV